MTMKDKKKKRKRKEMEKIDITLRYGFQDDDAFEEHHSFRNARYIACKRRAY